MLVLLIESDLLVKSIENCLDAKYTHTGTVTD